MKIFLITLVLILIYFIKINIKICIKNNTLSFIIFPFEQLKYSLPELSFKLNSSGHKKPNNLLKAAFKYRRALLKRLYLKQLIINCPQLQIDNAFTAIKVGILYAISHITLAPLFSIIEGYSQIPLIACNNKDNYQFKCIFRIYLGDIILKGLMLLYLQRRLK